MSIRDQILGMAEGSDLKSETVTVPEWGGMELVVREMTAKQRSSYRDATVDRVETDDGVELVPNMTIQEAKLVVRTLYDTDGNLVFTESDADNLSNRANSVIQRLSSIASRLSAVNAEAAAEAGKDSASTPDATSSSS